MRVLNVLSGVAIVAALLLTVVLLLPFVQTLAYGAIVKNPAFWYWLLIGGVAALGLVRVGYSEYALWAIGLAFVMAVAIGPFISGVYAQQDIVSNQEFEQRADLPETSSDHVRVLPRNVAETYAESANQLPKYRVGDSDIAYHNGSYTWSHGVVPDTAFVSWRGNQWGAYYVDMERTDREVDRRQTEMENGMGMVFIDSYGYQMNVDRFDVHHRPDTAFVFEHENETHIAQSYVTHNWQWRWGPIPQPYAVPEYGGTQVMGSDGNIDDLSPSEVVEDERLDGQNTYPYQLARFRMTSMQLQHGLLNKVFIQEDVPRIADTGTTSNTQPFTVPTGPSDDPELTYFIAATPGGSGDGIYQIYTIDSQTGDIEYVEYNNTRAGPERAAGYTRSQDREPEWDASSEEGTTQVAEPIPVTIDGDLYWHMRVTPTDGSRISYTTFVDSDTGNVYRADTTEEVYDFIESGNADAVTNTTEADNGTSSNTSSSGTITVVIVEDGEAVDRVEVPENGSVRIEQD